MYHDYKVFDINQFQWNNHLKDITKMQHSEALLLCIFLCTLQHDAVTNHVVATWHIFTEYNTNAQAWSHSTHSHQATLLLPFKTGPDCGPTLCVSNTRSFQLQRHGSLETLQNTHQFSTNNELQMFFFWGDWLYMKIYSLKCIFY